MSAEIPSSSTYHRNNKKNYTTTDSLKTTCSRVHTTWGWGNSSPFRPTMTQSIQPGQCWSGIWTRLWLSLSGPARTSVERREHSSLHMLPIQSTGAWEDLPQRMGWAAQIQVSKTCRDLPKKTQSCNCCQKDCLHFIYGLEYKFMGKTPTVSAKVNIQ